ncbi:hypothetical protein C0995_002101, partial [Termitomyces sp. Mi166
MQAQELHRSKQLREQKELHDLEAQQMVEATKTPNKGIELSSHNDDPLLAQVLEKQTESSATNNDPAVAQVLGTGTKAPVNSEHDEAQMRIHILQGYKKDQMYVEILDKPTEVQMRVHILQGYKKDRMYVEILDKPTEHPRFTIERELIYT